MRGAAAAGIALFFGIVVIVRKVQSGCYQRQLCCPGRNLTCFAHDDGIDHVPLRPITISSHSSHPEFPSEHDGKKLRVLLPDGGEVEGSGNEEVFKYGSSPSSDYLTGSEPLQLVEIASTRAPSFRQIIFGAPFFPAEQPPEIIRYAASHKLIRRRRDELSAGWLNDDYEYSLLNRLMPMRVVDSRGENSRIERDSMPKVVYLDASSSTNICYCDEVCVTFGDCCSDYTFTCPPSDCVVSAWEEWSECTTDKKGARCGSGSRKRTRVVLREARYGGMPCPPLLEQKACFNECPANPQDLTTVALLLDYQFSKTRAKLARNNVYWDLPEVATKVAKLSYYCVLYEIGWVNRNCINKEITAKLKTGNTICAECQPEAQMHRQTLRCASDLNDGEYGFWKLIGPKSCNGIWTRISRRNNCTCDTIFPSIDPFLLV